MDKQPEIRIWLGKGKCNIDKAGSKSSISFISSLLYLLPLDESDIKSCQEFVAKAMEKDNLDLLFNFAQSKKTKSFGIKKDLFI